MYNYHFQLLFSHKNSLSSGRLPQIHILKFSCYDTLIIYLCVKLIRGFHMVCIQRKEQPQLKLKPGTKALQAEFLLNLDPKDLPCLLRFVVFNEASSLPVKNFTGLLLFILQCLFNQAWLCLFPSPLVFQIQFSSLLVSNRYNSKTNAPVTLLYMCFTEKKKNHMLKLKLHILRVTNLKMTDMYRNSPD